MSASFPSSGYTVLVAPLDWGLGHATRCIPIIERLLARGYAVHLAGSGASGLLLRSAFPALPYSEIPFRAVRYAHSRQGLLWKILVQIPLLQRNLRAEKQWLNSYLQRQKIHALLSDNRYGLWHPSLPCIFITHQLEIQTPFGARANHWLRRFHYRVFRRFNACWVPDGAAPGLAGRLAHPPKLPGMPTRYIGPLSRFAASNDKPQTTNYKLAVLLSGPEPQRSLWEAQLLPQLGAVNGPVLLLRGRPGDATVLSVPANVTVAAHLPTGALQEALAASELVLARSGYSTVMDMVALRQRSILVPTPGQPEQEYLARHLAERHIAPSFRQEHLDLAAALATAETFPYRFPEENDTALLAAAIDSLEALIRERAPVE